MPTRSVHAGRWLAAAGLLMAMWLTAQGAVALASESYARPLEIAQLDNDAVRPDNGRLHIILLGGR